MPALVEARRTRGSHVELADMSAVTTADLAEPARLVPQRRRHLRAQLRRSRRPGSSGATGAAIRFADVDGDGRDDYQRTGADGSVHAYTNTPADGGNAIHWMERLDWAPGVWYGSRDKLRLADVNGDRRADYLVVGSTGTVHAYFNDGGGGGGGFTEHLDFVRETDCPGDKPTFRDISEDGRADYVVTYDGGSMRCRLITGGNL
ncbi:FG-GAP-like repeat-containing protein [Streptomyces ziwulingensis]